MHTRAGDDQVTNAGQSGKGIELRAHFQTELGDLMDTAGHEGSLGIVTKAQTVADTAAEGDDVLHRTAELTAGHIGIDIEPQRPGRENILDVLRAGNIRACHGNRCRDADAQLLCVGGTGQHNDGVLRRFLVQHLAHALERTRLKALGGVDNDGILRKIGCRLLGDTAHEGRRNTADADILARELIEISRQQDVRRDLDARKLGGFAGFADLIKLCRECRPDGDLVSCIAAHDRQCQSECAGA